MRSVRAKQTTDRWQAEYALRVGVEGAINQVLDATGLRRTRYRGLSKVTLRHACSATAIGRTSAGSRVSSYANTAPQAGCRQAQVTYGKGAGA
ncbi:transposase [Streptomyces rapamycinicus]|uniref:transposase n=1 Tax=Streptomyces rapamycinicus TaxID=1226757 RepID=UPI000EF7FF94|nr:transposase [Streptomyces rapamycinicus NRRL 5491]